MNKSIVSLYTPLKKLRIEEETTFPDYCSDIVRILKTDACPFITNKKTQNKDGAILTEVSGHIDFTVVYLGSEGFPESYTFVSEFNDSIKTVLPEDCDEECVSSFLDVSVDNIFCKVQNPRRVNIRCDAIIETKVKVNSLFDSFEGEKEKTEKRTECVNTTSLVSSCSQCFDFSEEIKLPERSPLMERILSCRIDITPDTSSISDTKLNFWATLSVNCLYLSESDGERECSVESFYQPIELSESIECYDLNKDSQYILRLIPENASVSISTDNLGFNRVLEVKGSYRADLSVFEDNKIELTQDAYGVGCTLSTEEEKRLLKSLRGTLRQTTALREKIPLKDDADRIEGMSADVRIVNSSWEDDKLIVGCKVRLSGVALCEDTPNSVSDELDLILPINLPSELSSPDVQKSADISLSIGYVDTKLYKDGVEVSFDIVTSADVYSENEVSFISSASVSEKEKGDEREIFVYPLSTDTLWTVGKRYGVAVSELEKANSITDSKLKRVMKIPR